MEKDHDQMTREELRIAVRNAQKIKDMQSERVQLFAVLWVILGVAFASLFEDATAGGAAGFACAAIYAFVFHGRK